MSSVNETSAFDALGLSAGQNVKAKTKGDLGQQDFLNLMVTQLKNQDPFKPMESGDFLSQIAQFGTVSGITDLQKSFSEFATSLYSNQALQASGLVGRTVLAPTGEGLLAAGGGIDGAVELPASAAQVTVNIYDAGGQLVRQLPLGMQASGLADFHWNGLAADGSAAAPGVYTMTANAQIGGYDQAVDTLVAAQVQSVNLGKNSSGLTLNLSGLGAVDFSTVREIM